MFITRSRRAMFFSLPFLTLPGHKPYRNNLMGGELMMLEGRVIVGGTWEGEKVSFPVEGLAFIGTG